MRPIDVFVDMNTNIMLLSDLPDCCARAAHGDGPLLICPVCGTVYGRAEIASKDEAIKQGWLPEESD